MAKPKYRLASTTIASAATVDLGAAGTRQVTISGSAAISSFGSEPYTEIALAFSGAATLKHTPPSLVIPGGADIVTVAGDTATAVSDGAGNWTVRSDRLGLGPTISTVNTLNILRDWREASCRSINALAGRTGTQNANAIRQYLLDRTSLGGTLIIDDAMDIDPILVAGFDADLTLDFRPGCRLRGSSGFTTPMISVAGLATRAIPRTIQFLNPRVNASLGDNSGADSQASALHVERFDVVEIINPRLYGGDTWAASKADSGIEDVECESVLIQGGVIRGFADAGWYPTGGNGDVSETAEYGVTHRAIGTQFLNCNTGMTAKRGLRHVQAIGCLFRLCQVGASSVFVPSPQQPYPARRMDLIANRFEFMGARGFDYHGGSTGKVIGNTLVDFGFLENGTTAQSGAVGGLFAGSTKCDVKDNTIELRRWARSDQRGFVQVSATENGVAYAGGGHTFGGNVYRKLVTAVAEGAGTAASTYHGEVLDDVTGAPPFGLNAAASATYTKLGDKTRYTQVGASTYKAPMQAFSFAGTGAFLSAVGSLAAGGTSAAQTISTPGALNGDIVVFTPLNSAVIRGDVTYAARANTDQVNVSVRNGSGAAIDFTSLQFSVHVYRPTST